MGEWVGQPKSRRGQIPPPPPPQVSLSKGLELAGWAGLCFLAPLLVPESPSTHQVWMFMPLVIYSLAFVICCYWMCVLFSTALVARQPVAPYRFFVISLFLVCAGSKPLNRAAHGPHLYPQPTHHISSIFHGY